MVRRAARSANRDCDLYLAENRARATEAGLVRVVLRQTSLMGGKGDIASGGWWRTKSGRGWLLGVLEHGSAIAGHYGIMKALRLGYRIVEYFLKA